MQRSRLFHLIGAASVLVTLSLLEYFLSGSSTTLFYISNWALAFSIFYWINRDDIIINSLLVTLLLPIIFIEVLLIASGFFYDLIHLPTLLAISYILLKKRHAVNFWYSVLFSFIVSVWVTLMLTLGYAYVGQSIHWAYIIMGVNIDTSFPIPMIYPIIALVNLGILYLIVRPRSQGTIVQLSALDQGTSFNLKGQEKGLTAAFQQLQIPLQMTSFIAYISGAYYIGFSVYGTPYLPLVLCTWWFGATIVFFLNTRSLILNSYLVTSMVPMMLFLAQSLTQFNPYGLIDWQHLLPLAVVFGIFYYNRPISIKLIWAFVGIEIGWFLAVHPIVYSTMHPFLFIFCALMTAISITLLTRYRLKRAMRLRLQASLKSN